MNTQEKFASARSAMKAALIERDDEIDLVLTALLAGEHPLLVGPPGTAKSMLLDSLLRWIAPTVALGKRALPARSFSVLFTKFTTPEEVFGPISVTGLKEDRYRRVTTGKLPEADLAFADEIFKASSAILNTMLRILNERVYENGDGKFAPVPLLICVAASNEWPGEDGGGKELGALFDRFLFRKRVSPIRSKAGRSSLLWSKDLAPKFTCSITADEIRSAQTEIKLIPWSLPAKDALITILDRLNTEGIMPGDRRMRKSVDACRAFAYLSGADEVEPEHLEVLAHTLWDDPTEQPDKVAKIVGQVANPVGSAINSLLVQAESVAKTCSPTDAVPKLRAIQTELKGMNAHPRRDIAITILASQIKDLYNKVVGVES
jgi:MoxR-like ATPase